MPKWRLVRAGALLVLLALPACQITWREPVLQPLNSNRYYDSGLETTCAAALQVVTRLGLSVKESQEEERACLLETDFKVLSDFGDDPTEYLDKVAFVGVGPFIGGRYTLTVTTRDVRNSGTRVKVTTRVEDTSARSSAIRCCAPRVLSNSRCSPPSARPLAPPLSRPTETHRGSARGGSTAGMFGYLAAARSTAARPHSGLPGRG